MRQDKAYMEGKGSFSEGRGRHLICDCVTGGMGGCRIMGG